MIFNQINGKHLSFEFFPPKSEAGSLKLKECVKILAGLKPNFFSVTYGAGGSTQNGTLDTVMAIQDATQVKSIPHLSCLGSTKSSVATMLDRFKTQNIKNIVALRGDLPDGVESPSNDFQYGRDLVKFIHEYAGDHFSICVACYPEFHPQTQHADQGLFHFKEKVDAGADCAITQYFYSADAYFQFLESCQKWKIEIPIIPGIMPITNYKQLSRFSDACGAEIPRWIRFRLASYGDDLQSIRQFGEEIVTELCDKLLKNGAPGLHFYTLNKSAPSIAIINNLTTSLVDKISA